MKELPEFNITRNKINYYYWYHGTKALILSKSPKKSIWIKALASALASNQSKGKCKDGSWDSVCEWSIVGGRVYNTAMNALTLEMVLFGAEKVAPNSWNNNIYGVDGKKVHESVKSALDWLKRHQDSSGGFDSDNYMVLCTDKSCDGPAGVGYFDAGVTALAVLALLNYPDAENKGEYNACVENGVKFLIAQQDNTGLIGPKEGESYVYNHAIATYALCEVLARTKDENIRKNLESAIKYILDAQNPGFGWKYEPRGGKNDTSVTCWMITALNSAKKAGFTVPDQSFKDALAWVNKVTYQSGRTWYEKDYGCGLRTRNYKRHETMTAAGIITRIFCGQKRGEEINKGIELILKDAPEFDNQSFNVNYNYWYHGAKALLLSGSEKNAGWIKTLISELLSKQSKGGCKNGSWDSICEYSVVGGRVYGAAMNALTLEMILADLDKKKEE
jgi:hypothetical protein